jgi:hypothetical protein
MQITAVDANANLFDISNVYSPELVEKITTTDWMNQPWTVQPCQESWARQRIELTAVSWADEWIQQTHSYWPQLSAAMNRPLRPYSPGLTYFWVDLPGFTCDLHTDGTLPGAMQLAWHGSNTLSTCFYQHSDAKQIRFRSQFVPNSGYVMINPEGTMDTPGLWHDMPQPVPSDQFRVTSYTLLHLL